MQKERIKLTLALCVFAVIYLCVNELLNLWEVLLRACSMGMCNGDFQFIMIFNYDPGEEPWRKNLSSPLTDDELLVREGFRHTLMVKYSNHVFTNHLCFRFISFRLMCK